MGAAGAPGVLSPPPEELPQDARRISAAPHRVISPILSMLLPPVVDAAWGWPTSDRRALNGAAGASTGVGACRRPTSFLARRGRGGGPPARFFSAFPPTPRA